VPFALVMPLLVYMPPAFLALTLPMATLVAVLLVGGARERPGGGRAQGRGGEPAPALPPVPRGGHRHHPAHRTFSATFNQFVIYVDEVSASQVRLKGLLVSDERNAEQSRIIGAREGRLLSDETNRRITLRLLDGFRRVARSLLAPLGQGGRAALAMSEHIDDFIHLLPAGARDHGAGGDSLRLVSPRSGGRAMGIGVWIVSAAGYWVVHSVGTAFAQADLLPAALAAWTADIVFAGIGTALFLSART